MNRRGWAELGTRTAVVRGAGGLIGWVISLDVDWSEKASSSQCAPSPGARCSSPMGCASSLTMGCLAGQPVLVRSSRSSLSRDLVLAAGDLTVARPADGTSKIDGRMRVT